MREQWEPKLSCVNLPHLQQLGNSDIWWRKEQLELPHEDKRVQFIVNCVGVGQFACDAVLPASLIFIARHCGRRSPDRWLRCRWRLKGSERSFWVRASSLSIRLPCVRRWDSPCLSLFLSVRTRVSASLKHCGLAPRPLHFHNIRCSVTVCCGLRTLITRLQNNVDGGAVQHRPRSLNPRGPERWLSGFTGLNW